MRLSRALLAAALIALSVTAMSSVARGDDPAKPPVLTFDEIDHVYTSGDIAPPGAFDQDLRDVVHTATPGPKKKTFLQGAMQTLAVAGAQLDNVTSIVGSSGTIGQTLNIANGAAALAPVANMMGLAGNGKAGVLLQTYVLPHVSPSAAQYLSDFLSARSSAQARYPGASPAPASAAATPAPAVAKYGNGSLRKYTIASNGWVRIDDPDTRVFVILEPDQDTAYAVDDANRTIHTVSYQSAVPAPMPAATSGKAPVIIDTTEPIAAMTFGTVATTGFHTQVTLHVAADQHGCTSSTVTSDRVEYFAGVHVASSAANASPLASTGTHDTCVPIGGIESYGSKIPPDLLLLYQANTVERKTATGNDHYTVVIERGNVRTLGDAARNAFQLPSGYRQV